jgi:hypothetical protein
MVPRALLSTLLVLLPMPLLGAAEPAAEDCRKCADTGLVECRKCVKTGCPESKNTLFCSMAIACKACNGLRDVPCKRCKKAPAEGRATRLAKDGEWLAGQRKIDEFMERELAHAESPHFVLTFDIKRVDAKGGETKHRALHLYLDRLEALYARFVEDVGADPDEDFFDKTHVMLWSDGRSQEKASQRYTRQPSTTQSKLMGASPVTSIHYDKNHLHEEFELHQAVVHQVTHCLLSNVFDGIWPGNIGGGWIDAGLAHYYEVDLFGSVRHYCYVEADSMRHFKFGVWEPAVKKAVNAGKAPPLLEVASKHTTELTPEQHMFAWSYVDFVLRGHPGKFGTLARALKAKRPLKEALSESLGMTGFEFHEAWQAFVKERYSSTARRR